MRASYRPQFSTAPIATDAKNVIQVFNVGAERILGYAAAEVLNRVTPANISDPQENIARTTGEASARFGQINRANAGARSNRTGWQTKGTKRSRPLLGRSPDTGLSPMITPLSMHGFSNRCNPIYAKTLMNA